MTDHTVDPENQTQSSARRELYEVYADTSVKPRHKKKLIESLDEIFGYDLAFIVGLIMRSGFSGNLNVINQANEISGVSFSRGNITKIDLNDKDTFMGELLIKDGYMTREKLVELLQDQSKPLGELLILHKFATREQIISVLVKQMRLRLSKYINSHKYRVNFSETEVPDYGLSISYPEYLGLAHDWVAGRFNAEWLKLHYMELSEGLVDVPQDIGVYPLVKALPLSIDLSHTFKTIAELRTFSKIFASVKNEKDQEYFLKCFHYGIMSGQLTLKQNPDSDASSESVLKNIYMACSKKTGVELVETLANILKFKPTEIDSIFQAINNYVHIYTGDDYEMKNNMFRIVLEMLSKKQFYYDAINKKYAVTNDPQTNLDINKKIAEIYHELLAKNLFVAIDRLKKINEYGSQTPKIKLYMVWAKALMIHQNNIRINMAELDREFLQILPEDKDTAEYFYVKALLASLKKDNVAANTHYQQSIKLNPELKKYPPIKQTGSFIKKLFKLSIMFIIVGASTLVHAQTQTVPNETSASAVDVSAPTSQAPSAATTQDEAAPAGTIPKSKLPFVYLNQYLNYKLINPQTVQVNDVLYNLNDMIVSSVGDSFEVELKGSLDTFNKEPSFMQRLALDKDNIPVKHNAANGKFKLDVPSKENLNSDYVCLYKKNQFTTIQICKSTHPIEPLRNQSLTVNGQAVDQEGTVILNDTNNNKIILNFIDKNNNFVTIETIKRNVLPLKLEKMANSDSLDIQFIDAGQSRYAWKEKINLNQNFFTLKFDELMRLKQGIYFSNAISLETGLSETYIDTSKLQKKYFNKFFIEPIIVFSELAGKSSTAEAILRSDIGLGMNLSVDHYLENSQNVFGSFSYYSSKLNPTTNNTTIQDPQVSLLTLFAGYKYTLNEKWALAGVARLQEDTFFYQVNTTTVALTKSMNKMLGFVPEYSFYNQGKILIGSSLGAYILLPTDVNSSTTTSIGTLFEVEAKATYKIDFGRLTSGIAFSSRNQENDTYSYNSSAVTYRIGLAYLF
jgi:tetratricopeptide (TPR) repeat protein